MNEDSLAPLFRRIADGDEAAMESVYEQSRSPLLRFFWRLCRSTELAEDLLQDTFLSLWRYRHNFGGTGKAVTYLYAVALNEWRGFCAREIKQRALRESLRADFAEPVDGPAGRALEEQETKNVIHEAIASLPRLQRETFVLHRFEGLSCREIAETCGESLKTVESRLRLALQKLTYKLRLHEGLA